MQGLLALLHVKDGDLVFYSVNDEVTPAVVITDYVANPQGARVSGSTPPESGPRAEEAWLETALVIAEHESLPGGRVECDCARLETESSERVRERFRTWCEPAP
jgi:hypothetical protein